MDEQNEKKKSKKLEAWKATQMEKIVPRPQAVCPEDGAPCGQQSCLHGCQLRRHSQAQNN